MFIKRLILIICVLGMFFPFLSVKGQFYIGMRQGFGKNRIQYQENLWTYYRMDRYNVYFYAGGKNIADYTAKNALSTLSELERKFDYYLDDKIHFVVYNKLSHFRQSNIDYEADEEGSMGGVTRISGNKVFLYFEGDYNKFDKQIKAGLSEIIINRMMFGDNWKEVVKNTTLLSIPDWYMKGIVSYATQAWSVEIDNNLRDAILSGAYKKFNRLSQNDAQNAGHALWNYIAEVYGTNVIPNILYMTRVSRNIESGFLFVLGIPLNTLVEESMLFYRVRYEIEEEQGDFPENAKKANIKTKRKLQYAQWKVSPDGRYGAYTTNILGKSKVYIYDFETNKKRRVFKNGYKLDRINDYEYPLLCWHPESTYLTIINEKKSENFLTLYEVEKKKKITRPIFRLDRVLDASYSPDGKKMVLSAVAGGQSDIYVLNLSSNFTEQLTNDIFDDNNPRFSHDGKSIVFSSNRINDSLNPQLSHIGKVSDKKDLFEIDYPNKRKVLTRLTETQRAKESSPYKIDDNHYLFLSDESGIVNRYYGIMDSSVSFIDTTIHYRYFVNSKPVSNYNRSILSQEIYPNNKSFSEKLKRDGKYHFLNRDFTEIPFEDQKELPSTSFKDTEEKQKDESTENKDDSAKKVTYTTIKVFETEKKEEEKTDENKIDINNYVFGEDSKKPEKEEPSKSSRFITIKSDGKEKTETEEIQLPQQRNYNLNFVATDIISAMDFNFANQLYQPFNGGPYTMPGMGLVVKVALFDLFEDYKVEGGIRYAFNGNNEYFVSLDNRGSRIDKKYTFQRQTLSGQSAFGMQRSIIHQVKSEYKYPFSEVLAVKSTFNLRNDRIISLAGDNFTLAQRDILVNWAGAKLELIFDNTIDRGLNLYSGSRWKVFFENYQEVTSSLKGISIAGFDFRHYQPIHRDLIYAGRVAGSSSFGQRKLVYYMGAVDNWFVLSDREIFNRQTTVANDQNYYFQTIATNMRGFIQNIRNGNNFTVINNEVRFPFVRYFAKKPIKSEFFGNMQLIGFNDIGTAWTGSNPFSTDNAFNTMTITDGNITVRLKNTKNPIVASTGFGFRTKIWGYFLRYDFAWGIEDAQILKPISHLSLGLDF